MGKEEYIQRALILKRIGFKNYQDYLASELWSKIRRKQLREYPKCFACREPATQVHHGRYTLLNILGHSGEYLFSVCGACHLTSEFTRYRKMSPSSATARLRQRKKRFEKEELDVAASGLVDAPPSVDTEFKNRLEREA